MFWLGNKQRANQIELVPIVQGHHPLNQCDLVNVLSGHHTFTHGQVTGLLHQHIADNDNILDYQEALQKVAWLPVEKQRACLAGVTCEILENRGAQPEFNWHVGLVLSRKPSIFFFSRLSPILFFYQYPAGVQRHH